MYVLTGLHYLAVSCLGSRSSSILHTYESIGVDQTLLLTSCFFQCGIAEEIRDWGLGRVRQHEGMKYGSFEMHEFMKYIKHSLNHVARSFHSENLLRTRLVLPHCLQRLRQV